MTFEICPDCGGRFVVTAIRGKNACGYCLDCGNDGCMIGMVSVTGTVK